MKSNNKTCTAGGQISLKSSGGYQGCEVALWGTVPCTEEEFFNGKAHEEVVEHLFDTILPVIDAIEEGWLPEGQRPKRMGFNDQITTGENHE